MKINQSRYKHLKAKVLNKKKSEYAFDQAFGNVVNSLIPRIQPSKKEKTPADNANLEEIDRLHSRLDAAEKANEEATKDYRKQIKDLSNIVQKGDEQNLELSNSLKDAIQRIYSERTKRAAAEKQGNNPSQESNQEQSSYGSMLENFASPTPPVTTKHSSNSTESTETLEKPVSEAVRKSLNIGEYIKIGNFKYRVTNTFGKRDKENAVSGISTSEHSGGIDLVGYDAEGNKANLPISLTDGRIISITRHGDGKVIHPSKGRAGGYIMRVQMNDGKVMSYMHLGEDVWKDRNKLLGKEVKRGDILYEGDYSVGSGSQTAPHIKVRVSSLDSNRRLLRDHTKIENDPTTYALYGKYTE